MGSGYYLHRFFPFTRSTLRLAHFPAFTASPFISKKCLHCSNRIFMRTFSSIIATRFSTNAVTLSNVPLILTPIFHDFNFSISSSITRLNKKGERGQPCFTPVLIPIFRVVLPPTGISVHVLVYIFSIASIT